MLVVAIGFGAEEVGGEGGFGDEPAGGAAEVDGVAEDVGAVEEGGIHVVFSDVFDAEFVFDTLVVGSDGLVVAFEEDIWTELEDDVEAVDEEDEVVFTAGREAVEIAQRCGDLGHVTFSSVEFAFAVPGEDERWRVRIYRGRRNEAAEVHIVGCCRGHEMHATGSWFLAGDVRRGA